MILTEETFIYTSFSLSAEWNLFLSPSSQHHHTGLDDAQDAGFGLSHLKCAASGIDVLLFYFDSRNPPRNSCWNATNTHFCTRFTYVPMLLCLCECECECQCQCHYSTFKATCVCLLFLRTNSEFHHTKHSIFCTFASSSTFLSLPVSVCVCTHRM